MLGLLPVALLALLFLVFGARREAEPGSRRDAFLLAALLTGAWGAAGAELLTLARSLAFLPVLLWWTAPCAVLLFVAWIRRDTLARWTRPSRAADRLSRAMLLAIGLVLLVTGVIAALTPPNTHDCMGYHLPRQLYWLENRALAHYPSFDLRQLEFPPFAESISAQLLLLSGSDAASNLLQWFALAACAVAAAAIARDLGLPARAQVLAALLVVTIPPAVQQAVNAKNDLVLALWTCTMAWLAVRARARGAWRWRDAAALGAALGLMLYTKGTGYIFALPLCTMTGLWMIAGVRARAVPRGLLIGVLAAGLNAGHWYRNHAAFGSPLGLRDANRGFDLTNETLTPAVVISNLARNVALHTPTPSRTANAAQERALVSLHGALHISPSDPRTTSPRGMVFRLRFVPFSDGSSGAPLHLLLVLGLVSAAVVTRGRMVPRPRAGLLLASLGMFVLFCILLKWQPWHARLHIPMLVLLAPLSAVLATGRVAHSLISLAALAVAVPSILYNEAKPLLGPSSVVTSTREQILFAHDEPVRRAALAAVEHVGRLSPAVAGIAPGWSRVEYPLQVLLKGLEPAPRLVAGRPNFGPHPHTADPQPDAVIAWEFTSAFLNHGGAGFSYIALAQHGPFTVYVPAARADPESVEWTDMPFIGWRPLQGLTAPRFLPSPSGGLFVRRSSDAQTVLEFQGWMTAAHLVLDCRPGGSIDQDVEVRLNGVPLDRFVLPGVSRFTNRRVPLAPREGKNELVIRYLAPGDGPPRPADVVFRRIQVLPRGPFRFPSSARPPAP